MNLIVSVPIFHKLHKETYKTIGCQLGFEIIPGLNVGEAHPRPQLKMLFFSGKLSGELLCHTDHEAFANRGLLFGTSPIGLVPTNSGFSLHAGVVATKAHERDRLETICRYIARHAVKEERLSTNSRGEIIYKLKKPWDDGTTAVKFTPMELMEKLAALVPRPRVHLTRFHRVLAPHDKFRKQIVPPKTETTSKLELIQSDQDPKSEPKRMSWARLLKRVFHIDISQYPGCSGKMKTLTAIKAPKSSGKSSIIWASHQAHQSLISPGALHLQTRRTSPIKLSRNTDLPIQLVYRTAAFKFRNFRKQNMKINNRIPVFRGFH